MLDCNNIKYKVRLKCSERGAFLRSRQILSVIEVLTEEINKELKKINNRCGKKHKYENPYP